ncbi:hypothetical protein ACOSQ2_010057 [Xanthoceras sorbifolium]
MRGHGQPEISGSESEEESETMRCISCKVEYGRHEAGTCKECYEEASETEEELKREIEDLKAKVAFLRFWSPLDQLSRSHGGPCYTDVVLVASSQDGPAVPVPAHKAILVSRSPVFKAMLENEMEESRSGAIKISDISYEALRAFVNYLYTAEACLDEQMACDLLELAEKYQHNAKHLLDASLSLITDNMDKLTKREEYMELVEKDPRLVVEIYEAYLSKQVNTAAHKDSSIKQ